MAVVDKLKGGKSVLQRTAPGKDLPRLALYIGVATGGYSVRTPNGSEQILTNAVLASNYKVASGKKADALIKEHWAPKEPAKPADSEKGSKKTAAKKKTTKKKVTKKTATKKKTTKKKTTSKKKTTKKKA